jgi:hypothetical protein
MTLLTERLGSKGSALPAPAGASAFACSMEAKLICQFALPQLFADSMRVGEPRLTVRHYRRHAARGWVRYTAPWA